MEIGTIRIILRSHSGTSRIHTLLEAVHPLFFGCRQLFFLMKLLSLADFQQRSPCGMHAGCRFCTWKWQETVQNPLILALFQDLGFIVEALCNSFSPLWKELTLVIYSVTNWGFLLISIPQPLSLSIDFKSGRKKPSYFKSFEI